MTASVRTTHDLCWRTVGKHTATLDGTALSSAHERFRDALIEAGLLIPMSVDGLYGRGADFERIVDGIECAIRHTARPLQADRATVLRFPPVFPREEYERTGYIESFPHLTGAISTFTGGKTGHQELLADRNAGRPWDGHLTPAAAMLVSAACHPCYSAVPHDIPHTGELVDVYGYCFRHEPAIDPARMQAFRMREFVMIGNPEQARGHRDRWIPRAVEMFAQLGLVAEPVAANDPFFGRGAVMLAANQREDELKTELVVRLYGDLDTGTAIFSANLHRDHFGHAFGLSTPDGAVAHSACAAFGMERIALALLRTHGLDPASWPRRARAALSL
jgi:seryl-tRNA synthetase